jgi:hypothetical protein
MSRSQRTLCALAICGTVPLAGLFAQGKQVPTHHFPFTPLQVNVGDIRLAPDTAGLKELAGLSELTLTGVPDAAGRFLTLDLRRAAVAFEPGSVRVNGVPQADVFAPGTSFWTGSVRGLANSDAYLALSPSGTRGWFGTAEMMNHLMAEPVNGDWSQTTLRIVDQATLDSAGAAPGYTCNAQLPPGQAPVLPTDPSTQNPTGGPLPNYFVPIAFETAYEFYTIFNNLGAAQTYAQSLIAAISARYDAQIGAIFQVPYLQFYTSNTDPWTPAGCGTMLDQFRNAWDNGAAPVPAALYHLMTGSNCGGGVAYLNVLCNGNYGFGVSGNMDGSTPFPPAQGPLTWDFVVVAHEIGHNFNAIHTHDYNPPIDPCGLGNCSNPAGTIMSYCHTCPGGMSNISLVFAAQSATDMRAATVAAGCLQTSGGANDECAGAVAIANGANGPFSNANATTSAPAWPCGGGGKDLWYAYTATCFGSVTINTCGAPTSFDTTLQVFSGACNSLTSIACNDDSCSLQSSVTFNATQGTTYLVRAGGYNSASGTFGLNVACTPVVPNDECSSAIALNVGTNGPFWNPGATTSAPAWGCGFNVQKDVWFSYTAIANGPISVSTCTATRTFDTAIQAFTGTCAGLTSIACNDDTCGLGSQVSFNATTGTTYYFRVGGYNNNEGNFDIVLVASNDDCGGAFNLSAGVNGPFGNQKATTGAAMPCGFSNGGDAWFRYTSTACQVSFETCTATRTVDTVMEVFTGNCAALTSVGCNDDACGLGSRVTVFGAVGTTYLVRVAGFNNLRGYFDVVVTEGSGTGGFTSFPTGCGGLTLTSTGTGPNLGQTVGWQVTGGTGITAIFMGFVPINLPLCPACTLGATIDVSIGASAIPPITTPCDPLLIGGQVYVQGVDVGSAGGCASPLPFRLSNTIRITIG